MFAALFLAPDLFMLGYVFVLKASAVVYNIGYNYFAPFLLWALVYILDWPSISPTCVIWIAHIGFDRLLGFGLKYTTAFKDTHLSKACPYDINEAKPGAKSQRPQLSRVVIAHVPRRTRSQQIFSVRQNKL